MSGQRYIYASARVRANEKYLLSREKLNQMIDARSLDDAVKILEDSGYGQEGERLQPLEYEKILKKESDKLYAFLNSLAPGADEFKVFFYPIDYRNIKLLLKEEAISEGAPSPEAVSLSEGGSIAPDKLRLAFRERDFRSLSPNMKKAIEEALDSFARVKDPQTIDLICDRASARELSELAARCKNSYLTGYIRLSLDCTNIKTFVRCRRMGESWSYFETVYLSGGNISRDTFVSGYDEPIQGFAQRVSAQALKAALDKGGQELKERGSFTEIEKLLDDALIAYVKNAKYISFGIEPLIGYAVGKQTEIKNVRILLSGKLAELPPETLRERMREVYG